MQSAQLANKTGYIAVITIEYRPVRCGWRISDSVHSDLITNGRVAE